GHPGRPFRPHRRAEQRVLEAGKRPFEHHADRLPALLGAGMRASLRSYARSQRSQSMTEFALVAPVLLLLFFGIIDFGRVIYIYGTLVQAANEGARISIHASTPLPTDSDILTASKVHAQSLRLANPCPNGPLPPTTGAGAQNPPPGSGWIFITEPNPPATVETSPPYDAPGGETP